MKYKKIISLVLIGLLTISFVVFPVSAIEDYSYKISQNLIKKLDKMDETETIKVSVWFNSIKKSEIERAVDANIKQEIKNNRLSEKSLVLYSFDNLNKKSAKAPKFDISLSEVHKLCSIDRKTKLKIISNYNQKCIKELDRIEGIDISDIEYTGKYVPNIELTVTKEEVYSLISNENIESIYAVSPVLEKGNDKRINPKSMTSLPTITTNDVYDYTGINYLKNNQNESGAGIKIGLISSGKPNTSYSCFSNANTNNRIHILDTTLPVSNDATFAAAQIVGKVGSTYEGIAINSTLYCTGTTNSDEDSWKECFDDVLDEDVDIIDVGIALAGEDRNEYGDASKYVDAIINTENKVLIQGTDEGYPSGSGCVQRGAMAYNSIAVGMYRMNYDDVSPLSAYNNASGSDKQYKPDLLAPYDMTVYYNSSISSKLSNSASAATIVAGATALLMSAEPDVLCSSAFVKALLLNGTEYLGTENTMNSTAGFVAIQRNSGLGVLNVKHSLLCYLTRDWVVGTNPVDLETGEAGSFIVDSQLRQVRVTLCSIKENYFNRKQQVIESDVPQYKIIVKKTSTNKKWTSICTVDNKCSVVFTPPQMGEYTVTLVRLSSNSITTDLACVFTSAF